ncbi:MAG TPA: hypothetical protein VGW57_02550 [Chthoniobacterales bacterium]|nr:hypothetical protein [Chthoniobacterales bacterium]
MKSFLILALLLTLGSILLTGCTSTTVPEDKPKTTTVPQDTK